MNDKDFIKELISRGANAYDGYFHYAHLVAVLLPKNLHGSLEQLLTNPTWDGDVISKTYRDELLQYGLAVRVCVNNQQGFTAATYFAYTVMKIINDIKMGKIGA